MATPASRPPVGVVGAGTMGAGIAQIAAVAGRRVLIADAIPGAAERAAGLVRDRVRAAVAKGRLDADPEALDLAPAGLDDLAGCELVVEAVVEDLAVKRRLFADLEQVVSPGCVLASNSSSLSPTAMAAGLAHPERLVGLHFFNPVPLMRLVEVISGLATAPSVADRVAQAAAEWGKTVVRSAATPGFIVNRVARPFYAQAWRLYEEHAAVPDTIDAVLTGAGGFRMGPFALMDLIGHDVNEAVTRSVWAAFGNDPRFAPSLAQRALVEAGWLGRKTGRGVYSYETPDTSPRATASRETAAGRETAAARETTGPGETTIASRTTRASSVTSVTSVTQATSVLVAPPPAAVTASAGSPLRPLLDRSGVTIVARSAAGGDGDAELPGGALLVLCTGATATSLSAAAGRPVVVVDRVLDVATATAIAIAPSDGCPPSALAEGVGLFQAAGLKVFVIDDVPGLIVTRTVAMLANLAADALACRVASAQDIDAAMRLGVNYPVGPLEWARRWGARTVLTVLDGLEDWYRDGHYRASPLLRRAALTGGELSDQRRGPRRRPPAVDRPEQAR